MAVPWQAEEAPDPRLLVLNEPLATELGLDPAWLRSPEGLRLLVGTARPRAGRPRWRRPTPGTSSAASSRGSATGARCCSASSSTPTARSATCTSRAPGARRSRAAATAWPRSARCCASTSSARRCTPSASPRPAPSPSSRPGGRCAARPCCRAPCSPGSPSSHLRVGSFQYAAATGDVDLLRRLADHAIARHHPGAADGRAPLPRAVRGGGRRPGVAGRPVDARRVRPRGHEHRQHDDLGRDHRLRAVRLPGRLRPGHGLQLDRPRRALRLRQPAARGRVEPRPARRGAPPPPRRRPGAGGRTRGGRAPRVPRRSTTPPGRPACGPSSACPTASTTRWPRRWSTSCWRCSRRTTSTTRRSSAPSARPPAATPSPPAACSSTSPAFDGWLERWRALGPDADAMDRVNPVYIPRNHLVEEALAAATDGDLDPLGRLLRRGDRPVRRAPRPRALRRPRPGGLRRLPDLLRHLTPLPGTPPRSRNRPGGEL